MSTPNEIFIVFVSKYSQASQNISQALQFIAPHFNLKVVDIDNPITRKMVLNSSVHKFETVPSAMLYYPKDNTFDIYEGEKFVNLLNQGAQMVNQKLEAIKQQEEEQQQQQQKKKKSVTVFDDSLEEDDDDQEDMAQALGMSREEFEMEDQPQRLQKRKIGKTTLFPDERFAPIDDDGMISTNKYLPPKGEGHDGMRESSLPEAERGDMMIERNKTYKPLLNSVVTDQLGGNGIKRPSKKKKKAVTFMDDGLEDVSEEPQSKSEGYTMDEIMGNDSTYGPNKAKTERTDAMKIAKEALIAEREQMMRIEEGNNRRA